MIVDVLLFMVMIIAMAVFIIGVVLIPYVTLPLTAIAIGMLVTYVIKHRREDVEE